MNSKTERILALDVFRGLAIFLMIVVDAPPAQIYEILKHAKWEGLTLADFAFPGFVFAMGASAAVSTSRKFPAWRKILHRAVILFLIGLIINVLAYFTFDGDYLRLFGVLQRLALTYALGMLIVKFIRSDIGILAAASLMLILSSLGFHVYAAENPFDKFNNISGAVDLIFPGVNRIYNPTHDPEGLYGTIASTASMLFGFLAGKILIDNLTLRDKILRLTIFGVVLLAVGGIWSNFDIIAKKIWTAPFSLITSGIMLIFFSALILMPVQKIFQPLAALGKNPLFFFVASNVTVFLLMAMGIWEETFASVKIESFSVEFNTLLFVLTWAVLWTIVAEFLDRLGVVIKL